MCEEGEEVGVKNKIIDLEDMNTWPSDFCREILENKNLIVNYHQEEIQVDRLAEHDLSVRYNRPHNDYQNDYDIFIQRLEEIVCGGSIIVYHCTRLADHEIRDIRKNGLKMLTPDLVKSRIANAVTNSLLTEEQGSYLIKSKHIAAKLDGKWGVRSNLLFFCSTKSPLKYWDGVGRFFRYWGGEAIYVGHEDDRRISHQLMKIGNPCIVKCSIPFSEMNRGETLSEHMLSYYIPHANLSSFESRVSNLIEVVRFLQIDGREEFSTALGLNREEMKPHNLRKVVGKIRESLKSGLPQIEESHDDIFNLIRRFLDRSNIDDANYLSLKQYKSNLNVESYYEFDVILERNTRPGEVIDVIEIHHNDFHKLTGFKELPPYQ